MGVYLSSPVRDKVSVDAELQQLRYGASSMQGWRMYQEDAHNCCPRYDTESNVSLFAVYDGHGGAEVAQYTAQHLPDFLKNLQSYKEGKLSQALEETFLGFDETLTKESVIKELKELAGVEEDEEETPESNRDEAAALYEEATMPLEELLERYGGPSQKGVLRKTDKFQSPIVKAKKEHDAQRDEEGGNDCDSVNPTDDIKTKLENKLVNGHSDNENNENIEKENQNRGGTPHMRQPNEAQAKAERDCCSPVKEDPSIQDSSCVHSTTPDDQQKDACRDSFKQDCASVSSNSVEPTSTDDTADKVNDSNNNGTETERPSSTTSSTEQAAEEPASSSSGGSSAQAGGSSSGSSSSTSGSSSAAAASSSKSEEEAGPCSSSKNEEPEAGSSTGRTRKKRKNIIPGEGEDESSYDEDTSDDEDEEESWGSGSEHSSDEDEGETGAYKNPMYSSDEDEAEEEEDEPITGGEEPGSDSGCTSVVALLKGQELYVANAGDSRCVLCRAGKAIDMSVDHKPEDELEHSRITKAGGRVTLDGRVNGGLNLSRAIGDHCYKKNTELTAKEQMITALPDIRCMSLGEEDEFMVLACDGIWNVMTSQDVVNFVSERLKAGGTKLSVICEEMFDFCLAPDTSGDGTGCDNMTCIVIVFNNKNKQAEPGVPKKRRASAEVESTDADDTSQAKKAKLDK